jgi:hypothetical protein
MMKKRAIDFVGDLSVMDSFVLFELTESPNMRILEFGVGGSTQIFAQRQPKQLVSVETDPLWAKLVINKIDNDFPNAFKPLIIGYTTTFFTMFDLIFVDGVDDKRLEFAINSWSSLHNSGVMVFHDTRRKFDFDQVLQFISHVGTEVLSAQFNYLDSNMTVLTKRSNKLLYENWNITEGLPKNYYSLLEN